MASGEANFRAFVALSAANEAILRSASENDLYKRVCDAAVAGGGRLGAAALLAEDDTWMRVVAACGDQTGPPVLGFSADQLSGFSRGIAAIAFRTGRPLISNDCLRHNDCDRQEEVNCGAARSVAAVPIKKNGASIGALLFDFDEPDALDVESERLLNRMITNVSFALDNFEREERRRQSDKANERLARMFIALSQTNEAIHSHSQISTEPTKRRRLTSASNISQLMMD
ncbi:GAF domain-containing protein [Bradyrhizobium sp. LTSPM299]|uniref:GAF domain-containing protein n=1 Tax=Bradyrhizobium sp. LTSPM299 TaxID=1619233 RepID=UPI0009E50250|nr:GAF domain-containing protein [Bradyrhizobium sp. LTSPM299]